MLSDSQECALRVHRLGKREPLAHGYSSTQAGCGWVKVGSYHPTDGSHGNTTFTGHPDDTAWPLAHQRLGIKAAFTRDDKVRTIQGSIKSVLFKDVWSTRLQPAIQQMHHQRRNSASGATSGFASDFLTHKSRHMHHAALQLFDLLGRGPFLRRVNPCRTSLTTQGVVHIGQEGKTAVAHRLRDAEGLNADNLLKVFSIRKKVMLARVKELGSQSTQDAHSRIAGRRPTQTQNDVTAPALHSVTHEHTRPKRTRTHHVTAIGW